MSALTIVQKLRDLAKPKENREKIVQDQGCLPGLVLLLDNENQAVVDCAIEALSYLAECESNRLIMWQELGLVISLNCVVDAQATSEETRKKTKDIISLIRPLNRNIKKDVKPPVTPASKRSGLRRPLGKKQPSSVVPTRTQHSFFKPNTNKNARTINMHVNGLRDLHTRKLLEDALLNVNGIISFTIDMSKTRVCIRAMSTLTVDVICAAIKDTKIMTAKQVIKGEEGTEIMLSFGATPAGVTDSKLNMPQYLDDEEDENSKPVQSAKAVSLTDGVTTGVTGWISSATSWATNTLYW